MASYEFYCVVGRVLTYGFLPVFAVGGFYISLGSRATTANGRPPDAILHAPVALSRRVAVSEGLIKNIRPYLIGDRASFRSEGICECRS